MEERFVSRSCEPITNELWSSARAPRLRRLRVAASDPSREMHRATVLAAGTAKA